MGIPKQNLDGEGHPREYGEGLSALYLLKPWSDIYNLCSWFIGKKQPEGPT